MTRHTKREHTFLREESSNECRLCGESKYQGNHLRDRTFAPEIEQHAFEPADLYPMGCARCARDKYHQYHKAPVKTHHFSSQYPKGRCETCYLSFEKGNHWPAIKNPAKFRKVASTDEGNFTVSMGGSCCGYPPRHEEAPMPNHKDLQIAITEAIANPNRVDIMPNPNEPTEPSVDKVTLDTDAIAKIIGEEMAKLKAKAEATSDEVRERDEMEAVISAREYEGYPPEEKEMPDDITMEEGIMDHYPATRKNLARQHELGHTSTVIVPEGKMSDTTFILNGREFKVTNWNSQQGMHHPTRVTIELQALI